MTLSVHPAPVGASFAADLAGRRVLVTGASRGIAAAIARGFAGCGARVALNYSADADLRAGFAEAAAALSDDISRIGPPALLLEADLTQPDAASRLVTDVVAAWGGVDIVVLSASIQIHKDFLAQTPADIALQIQINLMSNIAILQGVIPVMRRERWGRIITIGSVQETAPSGEMPIYAMTKGAQENLVRNLALQNAPHGITVNNIAPGLVQTDRNAFRRRDPSSWEAIAAAANPMGRAGQPEDIVGAALFLASDAASFVTGTTIQITGGAHIPWRAATARGIPMPTP
ncbi:SDR family NAD(P)-dependent oxidoreductase [Chelatococcus asaccharovorans]|uniref:SDR family NAD(P)-dependent oxidoreductase n=1 Tax=Chelatococcus asaccharovorans TaxID=28210 RepID=UPI00224C6EF0|nr:SDR family oxidoreductase [Chelatococcus asaccharovorans]CAH1658053.1 NAD(P)-dependent dehydrogenase (Short-subunit alcohol dehydrogenase family) [Chelatococcus asaccharovorans]CAH1688869.1 NAD(P)-dependent dehydrogenase (Short-subunit alcohol dehydrogenase family) [Chelatococcus asaccharovorans]